LFIYTSFNANNYIVLDDVNSCSGVTYAAHREDEAPSEPRPTRTGDGNIEVDAGISMSRDSNAETMELEESDGLVDSDVRSGPSSSAIDQTPQPTSNSAEATNVTVQDIDTILSCLKLNTEAPARLMHLVNRLVPFAKAIPGTSLAFKNEKKQLHSIVASPLYNTEGDKKPWRWFVTFSNADLFEEYIFRMIFSDGNGNVINFDGVTLTGEAAEAFLRGLTKVDRAKVLREHPALATRSYMIKQELIMKYIVDGDQACGGKVFDHWIRVEFQRSLNAHMHIILSVYDATNVEKMVVAGQRLAEGLVSLLKTTCTAEVSHLHC